MYPVVREALIAYHRARLWWSYFTEQQMGATHTDLPIVLRERWDTTNRIKELENERTRID